MTAAEIANCLEIENVTINYFLAEILLESEKGQNPLKNLEFAKYQSDLEYMKCTNLNYIKFFPENINISEPKVPLLNHKDEMFSKEIKNEK